MSKEAELLKERYIQIVKQHIEISNNLNQKINTAKTQFKKKFYRKKLHKNNQICAKFLEKIDIIDKMVENASKEGET